MHVPRVNLSQIWAIPPGFFFLYTCSILHNILSPGVTSQISRPPSGSRDLVFSKRGVVRSPELRQLQQTQLAAQQAVVVHEDAQRSLSWLPNLPARVPREGILSYGTRVQNLPLKEATVEFPQSHSYEYAGVGLYPATVQSTTVYYCTVVL